MGIGRERERERTMGDWGREETGDWGRDGRKLVVNCVIVSSGEQLQAEHLLP
jgi:hypothetical protein